MRISDWSSDVCSSDLGLARMLDVDEHRFAVGGEGNARYFAFLGAHEEAAYLFADGVGAQHLIVALAFIVAAVAVLAVGLDPQSDGPVEGEAVGAVDGIEIGRAHV